MGVLGPGRYLKSFLDVFRFLLAEYQLVLSHGDPKYIKFYEFPTIFLNAASKFEYYIASQLPSPFQKGSSLQDLSIDSLNPPDLNSGKKTPRVVSYLLPSV